MSSVLSELKRRHLKVQERVNYILALSGDFPFDGTKMDTNHMVVFFFFENVLFLVDRHKLWSEMFSKT